jgi:hypothetical protein
LLNRDARDRVRRPIEARAILVSRSADGPPSAAQIDETWKIGRSSVLQHVTAAQKT